MVLLPVLAVLAAACDDGIPRSEREATIDRDHFITTIVELRAVAVRTPSGRIGEPERERILSEAGVGEDDLRRYVEVHGRNVPHMNEVWAEVQLLLSERLGVSQEELEALESGADDLLP